MSVAVQMDLADPGRGLLGEAVAAWPRFGGACHVVECLLDLPAWTVQVTGAQVDEVLGELARLASPCGGDDRAAAGALAWVLLPGASSLAHQLQSLSPSIDEVVASQLWLEVRSFAWQRLGKVAANILMDTRRGVLLELSVGGHARRADRIWSQTVVLDPHGRRWHALDAMCSEQVDAEVQAREETLVGVVESAIENERVARADVELLWQLAQAADEADIRQVGRGYGGLCSHAATQDIAEELGTSPRTIRRRAVACLQALSGQAGGCAA